MAIVFIVSANNTQRTQAIGFSGLDFRDEISERTGMYLQRPEKLMGCVSAVLGIINHGANGDCRVAFAPRNDEFLSVFICG